MKVVNLQQKRKSLTAIVFDDGSELLVDSEIALIENIIIGSEIENIEKIIYKSDFKRAKSRALWYLSRGDLSEKSLFEKLVRGGFSETASRDAVERMKELGLVNDYMYAKRLADYLSNTGISNREIQFKRTQKGIDRDIVRGLSKSENDEIDEIKYLIEHKYKNKLDGESNIQKVFAALVRKGFSYSDVKAALRDYSEKLRYSED